MTNAAISCIFSVRLGFSPVRHVHSTTLLATFLFNVYKRFFSIHDMFFFTFLALY